jgi:hypothetical protein
MRGKTAGFERRQVLEGVSLPLKRYTLDGKSRILKSDLLMFKAIHDWRTASRRTDFKMG